MEGRPVLLPFVDDGNEDSDACESRGMKALTDRHARWPKKDWYSQTKPH